jgi:hypothetical protein
MAVEPYAGLGLDAYFETDQKHSVIVIGQAGLDRFIASSRSIQEKLVSIPVQDRMKVVCGLGEMLARETKEGRFQDVLSELATSTGYSEKLIEGELTYIPYILSSDNLLKCLKGSLIGAPSSLNDFTEISLNEYVWHLPAGPSMIVSSGNSIIPTIFPTAISLITGNATLLRPSLSNYSGVVEVFRILDRLPESAARDAMREALAISYYPHDSKVLKFALAQARMGVINFWGGGSARAVIKKSVSENPHNPRFIVNGPMTGIALIDSGSASYQNAEGLALNVALYNQQLCSSPTIVVFEGKIEQAEEFAQEVATSLDIIGSTMPMGTEDVDHYSLHGARKCIQIKGSKVLSSMDESNPWTIIVSRDNSVLDGMVAKIPKMGFHARKRFIEIVAVDSFDNGLGLIASLPKLKAFEGIDRVQTVGMAVMDEKTGHIMRRLALMGVYRSIPLTGMFMRSATEPYDGLSLPALFTYTSYARRKDILTHSQIEGLFHGADPANRTV